MIDWPSGAKLGSVSMPELWLSLTGAPRPSASIVYICDPPSLVSTTARRLPSGDHAGALLLPKKFATGRRWPVLSDCT